MIDVVFARHTEFLREHVARGEVVHAESLEEPIEVVGHMVGVFKKVVVNGGVQHEGQPGGEGREAFFRAFEGERRIHAMPEGDEFEEFAPDNSEAGQFKRGTFWQILLEVDVSEEIGANGQMAAHGGLR